MAPPPEPSRLPGFVTTLPRSVLSRTSKDAWPASPSFQIPPPNDDAFALIVQPITVNVALLTSPAFQRPPPPKPELPATTQLLTVSVELSFNIPPPARSPVTTPLVTVKPVTM